MPRALLLLTLLAVACSGPQKKPDPSFAAIGNDVADEGDHEATILAFQNRLSRLKPTHADYPPTLERLALAYIEHADALRDEADAATPIAQKPLLERANQQQEEAIARFTELVDVYPDYEGTPASLLQLGYAQLALQRYPEAQSTFDALYQRYPNSEYVIDARLIRGDLAFQIDQDIPTAEAHYQWVADNAPGTPQAAYARYMQSWLYFNLSDFTRATETLQLAYTDPGASPDMQSQIRRDMVLFYANTDAGPEAASAALEPYATSPEELQQMLTGLAQIWEDMGRADWADAIRPQG